MEQTTITPFAAVRTWFGQRVASVAPGTSVLIALFIVVTIFFGAVEAEGAIVVVWIYLSLFAIILYNHCFNVVLPDAFTTERPFLQYFAKTLLRVVMAVALLTVIGLMMGINDDAVLSMALVNTFVQMLVTVPATWFVFRRYRSRNEELTNLQKALGKSMANVGFLKSQINPHFLFNVLNTLYGTAIQEKADRTGEAIQRLGDMMRFMLHENTLDQIPLVREMEYLRNYIALQRLRTDSTATITIESDIPSDVPHLSIPPMLLIPFVENAFKHGISFQEPSYIRIVLTVKANTLYFDVTNSTHPRPENDPEKNSNGIGLANVRQRLLLMYPRKHELIARESGKDFFVHLTIQLK